MCKAISSEIVIGNLILEAVERDEKKIPIEDLISFDKKINISLKDMDYFTKFSIDNMFEFEKNYPFFISTINDNELEIIKFDAPKEYFLKRLTRYFRMGLPNDVINKLSAASKMVLG